MSKAEEVLKKVFENHPSNRACKYYSASGLKSSYGSIVLKAMETYARLQIEADRERVLNKMRNIGVRRVLEIRYKETPIKLD